MVDVKEYFILVLLVMVLFLISCSPQPEVVLSDKEINNLPDDDPAKLLLTEETNLVGEATKYSELTSKQKRAFWGCWKNSCHAKLIEAQQSKNYAEYRSCSLGCFADVQKDATDFCEDTDGLDYGNKGKVITNDYLGGSQYDCQKVGDKYECSDTCYIFSSEKEYLIEMKCENNKPSYVQKNCAELGDYGCKSGICIGKYLMGVNEYFLENKGTLDCENPANEDFCELYNSANKYYGFGTYSLNINDMVIIEPFIFKWGFGMLSGNMDVVWVEPQGNPILLADMAFSPYQPDIYSIHNFQGIYLMTHLDEVSKDDPTQFIFTNSYTGASDWSEAVNTYVYQTENLISFADEEYTEFNQYLADSLQVCYDSVKDFLQIEPSIKPVQNKFLEYEEGAGCQAGDIGILCGGTKENIDNILLGNWVTEGGLTYLEAVEEGNCLDHYAQPHELTHIFIYATPLKESLVLNEGLAEYVRHKTAFSAEEFQCLDDGWTVGFGNKYPYTDLSDFELEISHYKTAACVWDYIDVTYGHEKFIEIMKTIDSLRFKSGTYLLFADIINPVLGEDVLLILQGKFNLGEQIVEI